MSLSTDHAAHKTRFWSTFRQHPASVGETYLGHMMFALRFAGKLFGAGAAALVHAVIPAICETTASRKVAELHAMCQHRGSNN